MLVKCRFEKEMLENFLQNLSAMTINNPIFIFVVITVIWFIPGIIVRRISEKRAKEIKKVAQNQAIAKLYPKNNKERK